MWRHPIFRGVWVGVTLAAVVLAVVVMVAGGDRMLFLIGATSDAHHQIEMACETCHAAPPFSSTRAASKALNKACLGCHEVELDEARDSHPPAKFRNPRMTFLREALDARLCTTCHAEHRPEITRKGAVTVAMDFCVACHSEGDRDVRMLRPSHAGLDFASCATSGCHNYHDNRALYSDFLVAHADEPWLATNPIHALAAILRSPNLRRDHEQSEAVAPPEAMADRSIADQWAESEHASAGVNCSACHAPDARNDASLADVEANWIAAPSTGVCANCHDEQANTFVRGRHGMRQHPLVAAPRSLAGGDLSETLAAWLADPAYPAIMTVAEARIPMRFEAAHRVLDCNSCHQPHSVDVAFAVVESCLTCHDDSHTKAFVGSPHHDLWLAELSGATAPGTGVTCATCHMPAVEFRDQVMINHNQNDTLRPSEKMIRTVCLDCHGLGFAIDALADSDLVAINFKGLPAIHVPSIEWAVRHAVSAMEDNGS